MGIVDVVVQGALEIEAELVRAGAVGVYDSLHVEVGVVGRELELGVRKVVPVRDGERDQVGFACHVDADGWRGVGQVVEGRIVFVEAPEEVDIGIADFLCSHFKLRG